MLNKSDIREFLYELVKIDSVSGNELIAIKFIQEKFSDLGYNSSLEHLGESSVNLIINNIKQPDLLIATHVDTVPIICRPRIAGELVYGTGAVDAKGSIASIYYALSRIKFLPSGVSIAIFSQEETSGGGAMNYLRDHKPKLTLILEPTDLRLSNRSFGYLEVLFNISSDYYHPDLVPRKHLENTSTMRGLRVLERVREFSSSNGLTFAITNISAKGDSFFIPNQCQIIINFHIPIGRKALELYDSLKDFLREKISFYDDSLLQLIDFSDPFETPFTQEAMGILRAYKKVFNREPDLISFKSWSDANTFHESSIPSYIFGPGDPSLAHNNNERISINDVISGGKFLEELIREFS